MKSTRISRTTLNRTLAIIGVAVIFLQILYIAETRAQVAIVLAGLLLNQMGTWGLASRLLPDRRIFMLLRAEVDHFLNLVRRLHVSAVEKASEHVESTRGEMHESVDRMVGIAATGEAGRW
jgi:hypothetical protein